MFLQTLLAQNNAICGFGILGLCKNPASNAPALLENVISSIIGLLSILATIWFVFQFIMAAIKWISAGGDSKKIEEAKSQITQAIIGLVLVFTALVVVGVIAYLLDLDNVLDLQSAIRQLTPKAP